MLAGVLICSVGGRSSRAPAQSFSTAFDSLCELTTRRLCDAQVEVFEDAYAAAKGSHALCILTEWDEFKTLDFESIYKDMVRLFRVSRTRCMHCSWSHLHTLVATSML